MSAKAAFIVAVGAAATVRC